MSNLLDWLKKRRLKKAISKDGYSAVQRMVKSAPGLANTTLELDLPLCDTAPAPMRAPGVEALRVSTTWPLLHLAAKHGARATAGILLEHGADVSAKDQDGSCALHIGVKSGHTELVELLLSYGADVNASWSGWTPLCLAIYAEHYRLARLLMDRGANVNSVCNKQTPLLLAVPGGPVDFVAAILSNGAKVNHTSPDHVTALHLAAANGNKEVAELLLDHGARVNAKDRRGYTPLHCAVDLGSGVTRDLVNAFVLSDPSPTDTMQRAVREGARLIYNLDDLVQRQRETVTLLLKRGADFKIADREGRTPIALAAKREDLLQILTAGAR